MEIPEATTAPTWIKDTTLSFPKQLPMEHKYMRPTFYVRKCYLDYYNRIVELLKDGEIQAATVSDAPGIGKSVFFGYFLKRFSVENPDFTIITASFSKINKIPTMHEVVVWRNYKVIGQAEIDESAMIRLRLNAQNDAKKGVLYLFDGSPDLAPPNNQMV